MVLNREDAARAAENEVGRPNTPGMCQKWTREIFEAPSVGDVDGDGDADAVDGWKFENHKHLGDRKPPRGVPVAFSGGSKGFGHRAVSVGYGIIGTDMHDGKYKAGTVGLASIEEIERAMGVRYLGWSEDISGIMIPGGDKPQEKPVTVNLEVISWNVYIGNNDDKVVREIKQMIKFQDPDVFYLYEATRLVGDLSDLGYNVVQLKARSAKKGTVPETANVACLVRKDIKIKARRALRMKEFWKGPKHGLPHSPRVYRWVKIEKAGVVWKIGGVHFPFGLKARVESVKRVRQWFDWTRDNRPVIAFGDWNLNKDQVQKRIAKQTGTKVVGQGIDLAVYKNCRFIGYKDLGNHGSDHPALRFTFKK